MAVGVEFAIKVKEFPVFSSLTNVMRRVRFGRYS
jgi:hypothetical protein